MKALRNPLRLQNAFDTMQAKRRIAAKVARIKPYRTLHAHAAE